MENNTSVTMKNRSPENQPYERFMKLGPNELKNEELLAIILRSGTQGCPSIELAKELLNIRADFAGKLHGLCRLEYKDLIAIRGIGKVKAIQILCISELAKRMSEELTKGRLKFTEPETIAAHYMEEFRHKDQEELRLLLLDNKSNLLGQKTIFTGTVNASIVSPREIYLEALRFHAVGIILLHNHPSGDPTPSEADRRVTRKVRDAGNMLDIPLIDHIILGDLKYVSFREKGYL